MSAADYVVAWVLVCGLIALVAYVILDMTDGGGW